ncbi:MAG TPA: hypothetical protein VNJ01_18240 [Bacteriovoracaceae bacterium]|nr:hypothetical protein [Bacteriovoracaceae bacterium]
MKLFFLAMFAFVFSSESFAQHRGGREYGRGNGRGNDSRIRGNINIGGVRIGISRGGVVVGSNRRGPVYNRGNGYSRNNYAYSCDFDSLYYNNQFVHQLNYSYCSNALNDVSTYGYFCDGTDMYRSNGNFDSSYYSVNECRTALRY